MVACVCPLAAGCVIAVLARFLAAPAVVPKQVPLGGRYRVPVAWCAVAPRRASPMRCCARAALTPRVGNGLAWSPLRERLVLARVFVPEEEAPWAER